MRTHIKTADIARLVAVHGTLWGLVPGCLARVADDLPGVHRARRIHGIHRALRSLVPGLFAPVANDSAGRDTIRKHFPSGTAQ